MKMFDIDKIFFVILGYPMSYIEFIGTVAGFIAVWLSAKANVLSWPIGILNVVLFFFLFYQVQLYPDMMLQVFFFVTNVIGWWRWKNPLIEEEDKKGELKISRVQLRQFVLLLFAGIAGTFALGYFASNLHRILPGVFSLPSAFPYADSFVTVISVITTFLMIQKKIENWAMWIIVDAVAAYLYFAKGIKFVGIEYIIFCFIASFGLWNWTKEYNSYQTSASN
jgi:nicotinamide mononucleotide transporter